MEAEAGDYGRVLPNRSLEHAVRLCEPRVLNTGGTVNKKTRLEELKARFMNIMTSAKRYPMLGVCGVLL